MDVDYVDFYVENVEKLIDIFSNEKQLIDVHEDKVIIVGDLHGDYDTLKKILEKYDVKSWKLIFLGDYVDRGEYQLEVLTELLKLKIQFPDKVIMLRGNHESPLMNYEYGFVYELLRKVGEQANLIYLSISQLFANMPYAVLLNDEVLLLHGGLPNNLENIQDINNIPKGDNIPRNKIALQILWNDPSDNVQGFQPNYLRGYDPVNFPIYVFGPDITSKFLRKNNLKLIIRAHEYFENGYKWYHNGQLLSIFTSRAGPYSFVKPKIVVYQRGSEDIKDRVKVISP